MSETKLPICPKHQKQVIFVCSFQTCKEHRLICEVCKQKETLHFSHHANYIYRFKEIKQFDNTKKTSEKLEKGINDCQTYIIEHKKFYSNQINNIKEDFAALKRQFNLIAQKYEQIYVQSFQKQIQKFDEQINNVRNTLKQYIKQKNQQDSFFTMLFNNTQNNENDEFGIEATIKKNSKAYKVRADIISLRSSIAISKNNLTQYKKTDEDKRVLIAIHDELDYYTRNLFDKFKGVLGAEIGCNDDLKNSIASQSKSLAMSRVSLGNLIELQNDLKRSNASSFSSQRNLQRVELPQLNPVVASVREKLKPLEPKGKGNIILEGPYLFSTGVYFGQFQNSRRNGWGQFVFHDGTLYEGEWDKDNISGFGRLIRNDCYFEGNVKNGRAHGSGNYEDHYRYYTGEWKNDKRNGAGEQEFKNKSRKYAGNFVEDKYNGRGKLTTEEYVYEGKFKDGLFHGDGKIKFNNGEIFEGSFVEGEKHIGKHTYPDGSYYDGMFKDNLPQGTGQFFWADGLKYSGQWKCGLQQGIGVQIHQDGRQLKGLWKNGKWEKWL